MRRETQISPNNDANHRALRRCCACGSYARPFDELHGAIRCERCSQKAQRVRDEDDGNGGPSDLVV